MYPILKPFRAAVIPIFFWAFLILIKEFYDYDIIMGCQYCDIVVVLSACDIVITCTC